MLKVFERILDEITAVVKCVMISLTCVIFLITTTAVFTRYVLNFVPSWSEEVPRYLLVWITYLGAALAVNYKEHISLDIFFNLMPVRGRQIGHLILNLLVGIVGLILYVYGMRLLRQFGDDLMESIPVKNFWLYIAMPISGGLIILYVIRQTWKGILGLHGGEDVTGGEAIPY
jgi:TRAP-type C4-dicarboxylate transport system permease small subunit